MSFLELDPMFSSRKNDFHELKGRDTGKELPLWCSKVPNSLFCIATISNSRVLPLPNRPEFYGPSLSGDSSNYRAVVHNLLFKISRKFLALKVVLNSSFSFFGCVKTFVDFTLMHRYDATHLIVNSSTSMNWACRFGVSFTPCIDFRQ